MKAVIKFLFEVYSMKFNPLNRVPVCFSTLLVKVVTHLISCHPIEYFFSFSSIEFLENVREYSNFYSEKIIGQMHPINY